MTAFVILHYLALDSTRACVERVRELTGEKHIIVMDNASPNGSGEQLLEEYRDDVLVTVLLSDENSGFARGNDLGVEYAVATLEPDFVVALNDDVEILQPDFCERIESAYAAAPFDLLGPDIVSRFSGIHQSPKRMDGVTLAGVRGKAAYVRRSQNPVIMYLSSEQKRNVAIYKSYLRRRREKQGIDSLSPADNVVLHGACVIFSRRFLRERPRPFYPGTFMYYEMEILDWICRRDGYVSRYDPSLQVLHYQNVSTRMSCKSLMAQNRFVCANLLSSLQCAERLFTGVENLEEDGVDSFASVWTAVGSM